MILAEDTLYQNLKRIVLTIENMYENLDHDKKPLLICAIEINQSAMSGSILVTSYLCRSNKYYLNGMH